MSLKSFIRDHSAVAAAEFALVLPVLVLVFFGLVEITRFTLIHQKLLKTTYTLADVITQGARVCNEDIDGAMFAVDQVMRPFTFAGGNNTAIFTSVSSTITPPNGVGCAPDTPCVGWQVSRGPLPSSVGVVRGGVPNMPNGSVISSQQTLIVVETLYRYSPMLDVSATILPMLAPRDIYNVAVMKPRVGTMTTFCPDP